MAAAATLGRLVAILSIDTRSFDTGLSQAQRRASQLGRQMQTVGRQLTLGLTVPIAAAGAAIVRSGFNFQREMNRVGALTGAVGEEFQSLEKLAKQLGVTTAFSATEAAAGMGFLAQTGFETEQILATIPGALNLAAAGQIELARTADIASNVLQSFRLEAGEMDRVGDALAKTFTRSNVNLEQLADAMKLAAPTANLLGIKVEELSATIGKMGDAGLQGTIAGTSLNQALVAMINPTGPATEKIQELGLSFRDLRGELLPMPEILAELERRLGGLTKLERGAAINEVFGRRGGRAIGVLFGRSGELRDFINQVRDSAGTSAKIAERQLAGLVGAFVRLRSAAEGASLSLGEAGLNQVVTKIATGLTALARAIDAADVSTRKWILSLFGIAAILPPLIIGFGILAAIVGSTTLLVASAIGVVAAFIGAWLAFPKAVPNLIIAALTEIVAGFANALAYLIRLTAEGFEKLSSVPGFRSGIAGDIAQSLDTAADSIENFVGFANEFGDLSFAKAKEEFLGVADEILKFASSKIVGPQLDLPDIEIPEIPQPAPVEFDITLKQQAEEEVGEALTDVANRVADAQARLAELRGEVGAVAERELEVAVLAFRKLAIEAQFPAEAIAGLVDQYRSAFKELQEITKEVETQENLQAALMEPWENALENIQREWGNTLRDMFRNGVKSFSDFFDKVLDIGIDFAAQLLTALTIRPILEFGGGDLGGVVSRLFGQGALGQQQTQQQKQNSIFSTLGGAVTGLTQFLSGDFIGQTADALRGVFELPTQLQIDANQAIRGAGFDVPQLSFTDRFFGGNLEGIVAGATTALGGIIGGLANLGGSAKDIISGVVSGLITALGAVVGSIFAPGAGTAIGGAIGAAIGAVLGPIVGRGGANNIAQVAGTSNLRGAGFQAQNIIDLVFGFPVAGLITGPPKGTAQLATLSEEAFGALPTGGALPFIERFKDRDAGLFESLGFVGDAIDDMFKLVGGLTDSIFESFDDITDAVGQATVGGNKSKRIQRQLNKLLESAEKITADFPGISEADAVVLAQAASKQKLKYTDEFLKFVEDTGGEFLEEFLKGGKRDFAIRSRDFEGFFRDISRETPFGTIGILSSSLRRLNQRFVNSILMLVEEVDTQIARFLRPEDFAEVTEALQGVIPDAIRRTEKNLPKDIIKQRFEQILAALEVPAERIDELGVTLNQVAKSVKKRDRTEAVIEFVTGFFEGRDALLDTLTELRVAAGERLPLTETEKALENIRQAVLVLTSRGPDFGIDTADVDRLGQEAFKNLGEEFLKGFSIAILEATDPLQAALDANNRALEEALREAEQLGVETVLIRRRFALEEIRILEEFASSAQRLLEELLLGQTSTLAPPDVLANARALFEDLQAALEGGDSTVVDDLVDAAKTLLDAERAVSASSQAFEKTLSEVVAVLLSVPGVSLPEGVTLPGFQHGGSFVVPGVGGPDSQIVALRATPGEVFTATPPGAIGASDGVAIAQREDITNRLEAAVAELRMIRRGQSDLSDRVSSLEDTMRRKAS